MSADCRAVRPSNGKAHDWPQELRKSETPEFCRILHQDCGPYAFIVGHEVATDHRLSFTDLAVYIKCRWLFDVCGPEGDAEWLIRELSLPPEETRQSLARLVELGYLGTPGSIRDDMENPLRLRR